MLKFRIYWKNYKCLETNIYEREVKYHSDFLELISGYEYWCLQRSYPFWLGLNDDEKDKMLRVWELLKKNRFNNIPTPTPLSFISIEFHRK